MIKKILLLAVFMAGFITHASAQEQIIFPDTLAGWQLSWDAGLNGSQAAFSNWSGGGVDNLSYTGSSRFQAKYGQGRFNYGFSLSTRYGRSYIQGDSNRKTDDRLSVRNRFLYDLGEENSDFAIFGNIDLLTQFDQGFDFAAGPDDEDVLISGFFAPAYISENAGLAYSPGEHFVFEAGLGLRQTIVRDRSLSTLYGLDEGETFRNEGGLTLAAAYEQTIATNLRFSLSAESFTNLSESLKSTDVNVSSQFTGAINSLLNASLRVDLRYDDDFSNEIQLMQVLSVGISFSLL
ncbi:MAG: DUF3078 domain-containing protein [Balneolaceae bacterium]